MGRKYYLDRSKRALERARRGDKIDPCRLNRPEEQKGLKGLKMHSNQNGWNEKKFFWGEGKLAPLYPGAQRTNVTIVRG